VVFIKFKKNITNYSQKLTTGTLFILQ